MRSIDEVNELLAAFNQCVLEGATRTISEKEAHTLRVGIDLGTSSIVIAVVDAQGLPVYGALEYAKAVRDGLVVDYIGAVTITRRLKAQAEAALGCTLTRAAAAVPPGTLGNNKDVVGHVLEGADFTVSAIYDEPTAAAKVLGQVNGAVVDVGGGTTGITIIKRSKVSYTVDEPTGGSHMTLVLSGSYGLSQDEAEVLKRDASREREVYPLVRPVVEKMATISADALVAGKYRKNGPVYVVGGATNFTEFADTFKKVLGREVIKPLYPEFVTPLGIALGSF